MNTTTEHTTFTVQGHTFRNDRFAASVFADLAEKTHSERATAWGIYNDPYIAHEYAATATLYKTLIMEIEDGFTSAPKFIANCLSCGASIEADGDAGAGLAIVEEWISEHPHSVAAQADYGDRLEIAV